MSRRKVKAVLWLAFVCAIDDRQSLVDAYRGDKSEEAVRNALADIRDIRALQRKIFGTTKTALDAEMEKSEPISVFEFRKLVETNPELFDIHTDESESENQ